MECQTERSLKNNMAEPYLQDLIERFNSISLIENDFIKILDDLLIISVNSQKFASICSSIKVEILFDIVQSSQKGSEELQKSIKLLSKILNFKPATVVANNYGSRILECRTSELKEYQILCLNQILRLVEEEEGDIDDLSTSVSLLMNNSAVIVLVISFLTHKDISIANICRKILNSFFKIASSNVTNWFFCNDVLSVCDELIKNGDSTVQFRIYEIFVDFVLKHPEKLDLCRKFGVFEGLLLILKDGDDVLAQLNALDLLSKLAISGEQGFKYIEENSLMNWVEKTILSNNHLVTFLIPGAIKFFGTVASKNPLEILSKHETVQNYIFKQLQSEDTALKCLCVETVSHICSFPDGLKYLYNQSPDQMKFAIQMISNIIRNATEEDYLREKAAHSLSTIFFHKNDIEISMICEKLYQQIDASPLDMLLHLAQKPYAELRYSSLKILVDISRYGWAEQDMAHCAGFLEYLLDRKTETNKRGHELKYEIVNNLALSATSKNNFGIDYYNKLTKYAKQGVFSSESQVALSFQEES